MTKTESLQTLAEQEALTDQPYLTLLDDISFQPVFILGDHRSGTTLLYQLLDSTGCFNVVRAYHLINYEQILANHLNQQEQKAGQRLQTLFDAFGLTDRLLDGVQISPHLPEEYGFHLGATLRPKLTPGNLSRFIELCRKVQFVSDLEKPLLLKNPWDFMNFTYLNQAFPAAKFIFIHRNPVQLIDSQLRAARQLYRLKSPYHALLDEEYGRLWKKPLRLNIIRLLFSTHLNLGFRVTLRHVQRTTSYYLSHIHRLSPADYTNLTYEALCQYPESVITRILEFLGVEAVASVDYQNALYNRDRPLLAEVAQKRDLILKQFQPYIAYCNDYTG